MPLGALLDLKGFTMIHIVITFISPIHKSVSDSPVAGGSPEIGAL